MTQEDINKDGKPTPPSEENQDENKEKPVEADPNAQEDTDFEKELEALEDEEEEEKPQKPQRSERERAEFTLKSTAKRLKELGGDPSEILGTEPKPIEKPAIDTNQFVTKLDLAQQEADRMAKSPGESKLIMWYVKNKGMSVSDAHYMANKGKIIKALSEVDRTRSIIPAPANGGPGGRPPDKTDAPELSPAEKQYLSQSNMVYDPKKKAYIGSKVQLRYDEATKAWVNEKI